MDKFITILSKASDRYGNPYLTGFMEQYHLIGLMYATTEQFEEYIRTHGLKNESGEKIVREKSDLRLCLESDLRGE